MNKEEGRERERREQGEKVGRRVSLKNSNGPPNSKNIWILL
jgi:hypothetical protein